MSAPPGKHVDDSPDEPVEPVDETADATTRPEPAGPTRRERRGGSSAKVLGPPPGRRYPVPAKPRDYATRRRG